MKFAIIGGSIRQNRAGRAIAEWLKAQFEDSEHEYEIVDIADFNLPLLSWDEIPGMQGGVYTNEAQSAWGAKVAEFDGYVILTPEYNHSIPGALKNAIDLLAPEWVYKTVGYVTYGASGGARAAVAAREVFANFSAFQIRPQLAFSIFTDFADGAFAPNERAAQEARDFAGELEKVAAATASLR